MLLHSNVMLNCTNLQTCPVSTCQIYELARQPRLQNFLKGKMFLKHYFVINDFSDIVFFKKILIPHMEVFSLLELSLPDTLIWNFLRLAINGCWVWISSGTAHSVSKDIRGNPKTLTPGPRTPNTDRVRGLPMYGRPFVSIFATSNSLSLNLIRCR